LSLTAKLTFAANLARHARDFAREGVQLVTIVLMVSSTPEFSPSRPR